MHDRAKYYTLSKVSYDVLRHALVTMQFCKHSYSMTELGRAINKSTTCIHLQENHRSGDYRAQLNST